MILVILRWKVDLGKMIYNWRLSRAVRKANKWSRILDKKYLVIAYNNKPKAYQKSALKDLIKRRKFFRKGVTVEQLERMALYITK